MWLSDKGFRTLIQKEWKGVGKAPAFIRLKMLKRPIKEWHKKNFGNLESQAKTLEDEISRAEKELEVEVDNQELVYRLRALSCQLHLVRIRRAQIWRQRSRLKNLKEKDANTKIFHTITNLRKRKNQILELQFGDSVIKDPAEIKLKTVEYFRNFI